MLKIISANNISKLEKESEEYNISEIGSLTVSNGHYFLCFLGELKLPIVVPEEPEEPEVVAAKPVAKRRKKPNTNL
jgi:hypothetical protein